MFTATAARVLHKRWLRAAISAGAKESNPEGKPREAASEALEEQLNKREGQQGEQ